MPNEAAAESVIQLMKEAAEANLEDSFRKGALVELPPEGDLVMTGDLHGNRINYQKIVEHAALSRSRDRHLILHEILHALSLTVDGRDLSFQVLEMSARLKTYFPDQVHFMMGNHDLGELLDMDIKKGSNSSIKGLERGLAAAYGEMKNEVREAYKDFIASMPSAVRTPNRVFISHSIPHIKYLSLFSQDVFQSPVEMENVHRDHYLYRLVWGRQLSQEASDQFAEIVDADLLITGHMPVEEGYSVPNTRHLILDSKDKNGCYAVFPLDKEITHNDLVQTVRRIRTNKRMV
ncbi:MAG: metallophosphoesterase [Planctomycetota bacterium]|nr:metallophosphoesterase [Planctomycetota bacterium]